MSMNYFEHRNLIAKKRKVLYFVLKKMEYSMYGTSNHTFTLKDIDAAMDKAETNKNNNK